MDTTDRDFLPPHCPHRQCKYFTPPNKVKWFRFAGNHTTLAHGTVQRFRCKQCKTTFSRQTYDLHYYSKRRIDWDEIRKIVRSSSSDRAKALELSISPTTIGNKIHRLAKWSLAVHHQMLIDYLFNGVYVADGFETFTHSQFHPGHLHILVGAKGRFVFNWDYQTIRRKGHMTEEQKIIRDQYELKWKPAPGARGKSFARAVLEPLLKAEEDAEIVLITDKDPLYARVIKNNKAFLHRLEKKRYKHVTVSSKRKRNKKNLLFPVNYMDREFRKDMANHVRETTRYSREANHMVERVSIYSVDHNLNKRFLIKARKSDTTWHWEVAGLSREGEKLYLRESFHMRPWYREDFFESFKRMWNRDIPGPESKAKEYLAAFWLA